MPKMDLRMANRALCVDERPMDLFSPSLAGKTYQGTAHVGFCKPHRLFFSYLGKRQQG